MVGAGTRRAQSPYCATGIANCCASGIASCCASGIAKRRNKAIAPYGVHSKPVRWDTSGSSAGGIG
jgi:hypothetical protein